MFVAIQFTCLVAVTSQIFRYCIYHVHDKPHDVCILLPPMPGTDYTRQSMLKLQGVQSPASFFRRSP